MSLKEKVRVQVGGEVGGDELGVLTARLIVCRGVASQSLYISSVFDQM